MDKRPNRAIPFHLWIATKMFVCALEGVCLCVTVIVTKRFTNWFLGAKLRSTSFMDGSLNRFKMAVISNTSIISIERLNILENKSHQTATCKNC